MRKRSTLVLCLGGVLLLAACGGKNTESAGKASSAKAPATTTSSTDTSKAVSADETTGARGDSMAEQVVGGIAAMANPNAPKHWGLELKGVDLPEQSGSAVMTMEMPGSTAHYTFMGREQMTTLDIANAKLGEAGTFKPMNLQIIYTAKKWTCGASAMDKRTDVAVVVKPRGDGYRVTLDGTVMCGAVGPGASGERKPATLHAWFEK